jgi:S1-C subfamily serine protease
VVATASGLAVAGANRGGSPSTIADRAAATAFPTAQPIPQSSTNLSTSAIYDAVDPAIVDINTTLDGGEAAGTGMVLTASGLVLTNNHVIAGATSIEVQIAGTGPTYTAHVVGYDVSDDVAVLQLDDASNLTTISVGNSDAVQVGDNVVAIGNALGAPGPHAVTTGTVSALDQTVTASDEGVSTSETLQGLIATSASLEPGDSGGALVDASGDVIGMNSIGTVSDSRFGMSSSGGYAIPIDEAMTIAKQIVDGDASATVHIGDRGILGIEASETLGGGVTVAAVEDGGPAATVGLQGGDTITAVDGTSVASLADLQNALADHSPGDHVTVTWTTTDGVSHTATVTLEAGPPA